MLLVVVVGGGGAFLLLGGGDSGPSSPEAAVREFFEVMESRNCDGLNDLLYSDEGEADELRQTCRQAADEGIDIGMRLQNVVVTSQNETSAWADVTYTAPAYGASGGQGQDPTTSRGEDTHTVQWQLVKMHGHWYVDGATVLGLEPSAVPDGGGSASPGGGPDANGGGGASSGDGGAPGGGGPDPRDADPVVEADPTMVVRAYMDALSGADCERIVSLVTDSSLTSFDGATTPEDAVAVCESQVASGEGLVGRGLVFEGMDLTSNEGGTAVVEVTATVDGSTETVEVTLRDEDGWKVDLSEMGGGGSSGG